VTRTSLKISTSFIPYGIYFPSTPLPSLPSLLLPDKDKVDSVMLDDEEVSKVHCKGARPLVEREMEHEGGNS